ncbi:MAG: YciI-like protein [Gammaproteobacteria bacterium]|nr:YciI-like protein [Gammaproteobacteria bacterium]MDE0247263.1 YciI-like protein [Gammaproteobacteria bacterium]
MHYVLFYELEDNYMERRPPLRREHLALAWKAEASGELLLAGALGEPADGAMFIFSGPGPAAAERFAEADPYVSGGLVRSWSVRPWNTVVGEAASNPLLPGGA